MDGMDELITLLEMINLDLVPGDKPFSGIIDRFYNLYSSGSFRHTYATLSKYLEKLDGEHRDVLYRVLIEIATEIKTYKNKNVDKGIFKLIDHIQLESIRLSRMDYIKLLTEQASEEVKKSEDLFNSNNIKIEDISDKVDNFNSQSITILGIFSGLIMVFSAELDLFTQTFANLNNMNVYKICLYLCVIGLIVFDTVFLLLYGVSKISGHSIATSCGKKNCDDCTGCSSWGKLFKPFKILSKKYPYVLCFNSLGIIAVISLFFSKRM